MASYIGPLDELLDGANFAEVNDCRISGKHSLGDFIQGEGRVYCLFRGETPKGYAFGNITVVGVPRDNDPSDYNNARMYTIRGGRMAMAVRDKKPICLSAENPTRYGIKVARELRIIAAKYKIEDRFLPSS